jgi:PIN domain nuclease of toxin-antitoxin system
VRLLLDSHVLIWWQCADPRLGPRLADLVRSPRNDVFVSSATVWEIAIQVRLGRLRFPVADFPEMMARSRFGRMSIDPEHAIEAAALPRHHDDPFDRMLIARARLEGLTLASADGRVERYSVASVRP